MTDDADEVERMLERFRQLRDGSGARVGAAATEQAGEIADSDAGETETDGWRAYFPYESAYAAQADGIEQAIATGRENGFTVVEGACGSGKTLLSLLAGISLVRDPDTSFERVFVVTSVKQQLDQFEADLRAVNEELTDAPPVTGVTLVGKTEMCPYVREPESAMTAENVGGRCADLREGTRNRVRSTDPETIVRRAAAKFPKLSADGARAPYPKELTDANSCAFYAKYLAEKQGDEAFPLDFDDCEGSVADPATVRRVATEHGFCPHSLMAELQLDAEVIVGNYYHVFSPSTRAMTDPVIDDETFLVVDEAHMLESRVRDLFETSVGDARLRTAVDELDQVLLDVDGDGPTAAANRAEFEELGFSVEDLTETKAFLRWIRERVDARVERKLDELRSDWRTAWNALPETIEIPLRDPSNPGPDELSKWAGVAGYGERDWRRAAPLGEAVEAYLTPDDGHEEITVALPGVGRALARWDECDHTRYFREIELRRRSQSAADVSDWRDVYSASLVLSDCLPTDALADRIDEFGGGVLMSATLAPLSVFRDVVGLSELDRPVAERQDPLRFPRENRESLVVETTPFTRKNKGASAVREEYADVIETVARSPGSALVCLPSYAEAEWAAGVLERAGVDKPVLLDESATNAETQRLKERFFAPGEKVLVTSARGTLTEGVDYAGDRLHAALVCSVPFVKIGPRARAIVAAYEDRFGEDVGFEYALTVPAVRKARQALGRVVRGADERGVRVLADERYARTGRWNSAGDYLSEAERAEYEPVRPDELADRIRRFWAE